MYIYTYAYWSFASMIKSCARIFILWTLFPDFFLIKVLPVVPSFLYKKKVSGPQKDAFTLKKGIYFFISYQYLW